MPNMQNLRNSVLGHLRVRVSMKECFRRKYVNPINRFGHQLSTSSGPSADQILTRVIGLVKKFDRIDATKVTEIADFKKDLSLDSLDRVELVMAFEEEFSIEIPEEKADRLKCCADVAKYISSGAGQKTADDS